MTLCPIEMEKRVGSPKTGASFGPIRQGPSKLRDKVTRASCCFCEMRASFKVVITLVLSAQQATLEGTDKTPSWGATLLPHVGLFSAMKHMG